MKKLSVLLVFMSISCISQGFDYELDEIMRGTITPERQWWDLNYYHLDVTVDPEKKFISGKNTIRYKVLDSKKLLQVDLQPPLKIHKVTSGKKTLAIAQIGTNAYLVKLKKRQRKGVYNEITVHYSGYPQVAKSPPWDGGFSWKKDTHGKHFIATSCQVNGASAWWPCKDHMYDEVDSMRISVTFPKDLMNVSNGRLESVEEKEEWKTTQWFVANPINNYGVNINIGDYINFQETYKGEKGDLNLSYWVLRDNFEKAMKHFKQVPLMLEAFEHWFGPYPFYEDGFKLIDAPYLGMEHQSSVTYGNLYQNGYLGSDLSRSGWGLKYDFMIIHESSHEWWGNNITYNDLAYFWIHEAFASYAESLYLECHFGKQAGAEYAIGNRRLIANDIPIMGFYGRHRKGSEDSYPKGANMLHTLRQWIDDDQKWRKVLKQIVDDFYNQSTFADRVEEFISKTTGKNLSPFFYQYIEFSKVPYFDYSFDGKQLKFRYHFVDTNFTMPLRIFVDGRTQWIFPKERYEWKTIELEGKELVFDKTFYVNYKEIMTPEPNSTTE